MLKNRLIKWGFEKYLKEADVAQALLLIQQRQADGRYRNELSIKGRRVTISDINEYLRRKRIRDTSEMVRVAASLPPSPRIFAYTPPPSPGPSIPPLPLPHPFIPLNEILSVNDPDLDEFEEFPPFFDPPISPIPVDPTELARINLALSLNSQYFYYLSTGGPKIATYLWEGPEGQNLKMFTSGMWRCHDLLLEDRSEDAQLYFAQAIAVVSSVVQDRSRKLLPELYEMLLTFQLPDNKNFLPTMLDFIGNLSSRCEDATPYISEIAQILLSLDILTRTDTAEKLLRDAAQHFQSRLSPTHPETLSMNKALARSAFMPQERPWTIESLHTLLDDPQALAIITPYDHCNALTELALCYRAQQLYSDAKQRASEAWVVSDLIQSPTLRADMQITCLRIKGWVAAKTGDRINAKDYGQRALDLSVHELGWEDSLTALVAAEFEELRFA